MYRAFELKLSESDTEEILDHKEWYHIGKSCVQQSGKNIQENLRQLVRTGKILDGQQLRDKVFPAFQKQIFISHSHNDEDLMYCISGMLKNEFNLSVFADEFFWGSADGLLKEIDDVYCKIQGREHLYSYEDRNLTTSHVHVMLSAAIMKAIDQCEMLLFLNTDNSVPNIEEVFQDSNHHCTMSPWIYQELLFASMVKPKSREYIEKGTTAVLSEALKVAYKIPDIEELTLEEICSWHESFRKCEGKNALDFLYELKRPSSVMG